MNEIFYRDGYTHQTTRNYFLGTHVVQASRIRTQFISLDETGYLEISAGYAWDGPSGPAIDTPNSMRASLVHDALYQLMRMGLLDRKYRHAADREFRRICIEDGMSKFRAWYFYKGVDIFAAKAAMAAARNREHRAPTPFPEPSAAERTPPDDRAGR